MRIKLIWRQIEQNMQACELNIYCFLFGLFSSFPVALRHAYTQLVFFIYRIDFERQFSTLTSI